MSRVAYTEDHKVQLLEWVGRNHSAGRPSPADSDIAKRFGWRTGDDALGLIAALVAEGRLVVVRHNLSRELALPIAAAIDVTPPPLESLDEDQAMEALRMRDAGHTRPEIATRLGCLQSAIDAVFYGTPRTRPPVSTGTGTRMTPEEDATILRERADGVSFQAIARLIGRTAPGVYSAYKRLTNGLPEQASEPAGVESLPPGQKRTGPFTAEEDELFLLERRAGTPLQQIADKLNRSYFSVQGAVKRHSRAASRPVPAAPSPDVPAAAASPAAPSPIVEVADVAELGERLDALREAIKSAAADATATVEAGPPPPTVAADLQRTGNAMGVRLSATDHARLTAAAKARDIPVARSARELIVGALDGAAGLPPGCLHVQARVVAAHQRQSDQPEFWAFVAGLIETGLDARTTRTTVIEKAAATAARCIVKPATRIRP